MPRLKCLLSLLVMACGQEILASTSNLNSEHKIHNIVLYPDKHSWCKTTEIKQIVEYPGCESVEIDNSVCVGACFSYSIPRSSPSAPSEVITPYCDSCQPANYTWQHVTLNCRGDGDGESEESATVEMTKKVQIIRNCSCASCNHLNMHQQHHDHHEVEAADVPEIIKLMVPRNTTVHQTAEDKMEFNKVLNILLQKKELDNGIEVDDEIEKMADDGKEEDDLEVLNVNHPRAEAQGEVEEHVKEPHGHHEGGTHLVEGPHHSLVLKPDVIPEHHQVLPPPHHRVHHEEEEEEVPSLLRNQFKVHDHEEYLDQIAVESHKEYREEPSEVILSVPELIYKEAKEEEKDEDVTESGKEGDYSSEAKVTDEEILPSLKDDSPKIIKIADVDHEQLSPAIEGAQVSYIVKNDPKE